MRAFNRFVFALCCCSFGLWMGCNNETATTDTNTKPEKPAKSQAEATHQSSKQLKRPKNPIGDTTTNPVIRPVKNDFQPKTGFNSKFVNSMRKWTDSANQFSTRAELIAVAMKTRKVKLLKENGVTITVDYDTLSYHDQNYITEFVFAQRTVHQPKLVENFD